MRFINTSRKAISFRVWLLAVVALLLILPQVMSASYVRLLTEVIIVALFATSLNLMFGYGGMLSLGHAAFFGIGAYTFGLLTLRADFPWAAAMVSAALVAAIIGLVIGYFCIRLTTDYFVMLSLGFGQIIYLVILKWYSLTGGENGLVDISKPGWFSTIGNFYYFTLVLILISFVLIRMMVNSPFGKVIQGIRENKERMQFVGINVKRFQLITFSMSTFFAGFAGVLYALLNGGAYPTYSGIEKSLEAVVMCLIGGIHSFIGPSIGALMLVVLGSIAARYTEYWPAFLGAILIFITFGFRKGIVGTIREKYMK